MYKKIISIVTVIFLTLISIIPVNAEDNDCMVTRAELANEVMNVCEYITQEFSLPMEERPVFKDIQKSPFRFRILQAHVKGFMSGVGDEKFMPEQNVSKCQAAVSLYRLMQYLNTKYDCKQEEESIDISDYNLIPDWGTEAVVFMVSTKLMSLTDDKFYPDNSISRAELDEITEKIKNIFVTDSGKRIDFQEFLKNTNKNI